MFYVGIAGHRHLGSDGAAGFVGRRSAEILATARAKRGPVTALSALAAGTDTLFAEAAIRLSIPLAIVRPFRRYSDDFATREARACYERLRGLASEETVLAAEQRSDGAYNEAMRWVLARSDLLVVAWDGRSVEAPGGTTAIVRRAMAGNCPWIHLDINLLSSAAYRGAARDPEALL
jgi:hypothetical protein